MLGLLLALTANAGTNEDFACSHAAFQVAASGAALSGQGLDDATRDALEKTRARAQPRAATCEGWGLPDACAAPAAPAAVAEATARIGRRDQAAVLAQSEPLPTLAAKLTANARLLARIEAVEAESDRIDVDADKLADDRAAAQLERAALLEAIDARHEAETAFLGVDRAWLDAAVALNAARCIAAGCARQAGGPIDPACPGVPHPPTHRATTALRAAHVATEAALLAFPEVASLERASQIVVSAGASGPRPGVAVARGARLWAVQTDGALRPATPNSRMTAVLARVDGLERASPELLRWLGLVSGWHSAWEREHGRVASDLEALAAAWARADQAVGNRAQANATVRIRNAERPFQQPPSVALPVPPPEY